MKLKQKQPSRHVESRSPSRSPSPQPPRPRPRPPRPPPPVLPQPPPPPPPTILSEIDRASIASTMVEVSCPFSSWSMGGTTSFITCRNRKRQAGDTTLCNIPQSLLHNIFLGIPALTLRSMTKCVCKEWNGIISDSEFVREHSRLNASDGFLVQKCVNGKENPSLSYFVEIHNDTNAVTIHPTSLVSETVQGSCGGFLYLKEDTTDSKFSVLGPVSGKKLKVPPSPKAGASLLFSGFAQDRRSGIYKVVHFYGKSTDKFCFVLSLGSYSQWRPIRVRYFPCAASFKRNTISAGRYVYCVTWSTYQFFEIITFDAETESIYYCGSTMVRTPFSYFFLPMEDSLSLVLCGRNYQWKVWKLSNFKPCVWEKICTIDLSSQKLLIDRELSKGYVYIRPISWLRNGKLILFHLTYPSQCWIAYDVRKGDSFWFEFPDDGDTWILAHFNVDIFSFNQP